MHIDEQEVVAQSIFFTSTGSISVSEMPGVAPVLGAEFRKAKFWLIPDAIRYRRTDTALVRIVVWAPDRYSDRATATAVEFGRNLYPLLRDRLPR